MQQKKRGIRIRLIIGCIITATAFAFIGLAIMRANKTGQSDGSVLVMTSYGLIMVAVLASIAVGVPLSELTLLKKATMTVRGRITGTADVSDYEHVRTVAIVEYDVDGRHYRLKMPVIRPDVRNGGMHSSAEVIVHCIPSRPKRAWAEAAATTDCDKTSDMIN